MIFLYPGFLLALFSLLIPLAIHLFNFHRPKKIYFSNVRFLRNITINTQSARNLRQWIILLTRMLMLASLVLAFAQPVIKSNLPASVAASQQITIYIDNSLSMEVPGQNGSKLDDAIVAADKMVRIAPKEMQFRILHHHTKSDDNSLTKPAAIEKLASIQQVTESKTLAAIVDKIHNFVEPGQNQILIYSDFQKSMLADAESIHFDSNYTYHLIPVTGDDTYNVYVKNVEIKDPFIKPGVNNDILITVRNSGQKTAENIIAKLFVENQQAGTANITLEPNTEKTYQLNFVTNDLNPKSCKIELNDSKVRFDNVFYFVAQPPPAVDVMLLSQHKNHYLEKVYANQDIFNLHSYNFNNLDYSRFGKSKFIAYEINEYKPNMVGQLQKALSEGATVFLYPGVGTSLSAINSTLTDLQAGFTCLPTDSSSRNVTISIPDKDNPFFYGVFEKIPQNSLMPTVESYWPTAGSYRAILQFKNQQPALLQAKGTKGTLYMATFALDDAKTNFMKNALFLPVCYRMALQSLREFDKLAYSPGDNITIPVNSGYSKDQVLTLKYENEEIIPAQYLSGDKYIVQIPTEIPNTGFFKISLGDSSVKKLAINASTTESEMSFATVNELQSIASSHANVLVADAGSANDYSQAIVEKGGGVPLWKYFIVAALFFLLMEILFLRFFTFGTQKLNS